ncbi:MAG: DUF3870 domain-containing protein [Desulfobacterales bacterium]|nr:DUF3870 domain-containing protein [Desulfobacterales bacterium]
MSSFDKNTVYIVGHAKTNTDNAITEQFKIFFISFVVDVNTDEIVDLGCSATLDITNEFIKSIFLGRAMDTDGEDVELEVTHRYFGSSQRAIIVAYKDAVKKYFSVKSRLY